MSDGDFAVEAAQTETNDLTSLTVDLLSAYFENNQIDSGDLAGLIKTTHDALKSLGEVETSGNAGPEHVPAVSARKSLASPDHILSMIDGKPYKTLKRHIGTHGLTPSAYRERYKLPNDYPLVAKSYSEHRRAVAEKLGLGRKVSASRKAAPAAGQPKSAKPTKAKHSAAPKAVAEAVPEATPAVKTRKAPARKEAMAAASS